MMWILNIMQSVAVLAGEQLQGGEETPNDDDQAQSL
jgi:hypothetical protein